MLLCGRIQAGDVNGCIHSMTDRVLLMPEPDVSQVRLYREEEGLTI